MLLYGRYVSTRYGATLNAEVVGVLDDDRLVRFIARMTGGCELSSKVCAAGIAQAMTRLHDLLTIFDFSPDPEGGVPTRTEAAS